MDYCASLIDKFDSRQAVIAIVGLGYVGLPLALRFADVGCKVIGIDIDPRKVAQLKGGDSYINHIAPTRIRQALANGFYPTSDIAKANQADAIILCLPTPLTKNRDPDLRFVTGTIDALLPHLRQGQIVTLESTTYPGTTEEELASRIAQQGFAIGRDFFLAYSPEREDPANANYQTETIPKVVGGVTDACLEVAKALYGSAVNQVVPVSSAKTAEMTKLLENIHRAVNIGLVNEMKIICDRMGIDIHEVIAAAATKPFGFTPYYPGPGLGGHCIPIDPFYLTWKAREFGFNARFIELAGEINTSMPEWVINKLVSALNDRSKPLKGSKILVLGIAYKKNVDDVRESPAIEIMEQLRRKGAEVSYSDAYVPTFPNMRRYSFDLVSTELAEKIISEFDAVLIATAHDEVDYAMIRNSAQLVVDTRGVYSEPFPNVVKA